MAGGGGHAAESYPFLGNGLNATPSAPKGSVGYQWGEDERVEY
jgi:hypothetical protein